MGSVNLDNTGSGAAVTLSSDGTNLLLDGTAIGGGGSDPDLYRDNASSATTPVASGTNAVAMGDTAVASGDNAFALGNDTDATGLNSLALGKGAQAVSTRCIAIGLNASASADRAISIGNNGNVVTATYGTSIGSGSSGGGSTVAGSGAVALSNARAGGSDSFAAIIADNTSSYGATGSGSAAIMNYAKASGNNSVAFGFGANATNWGACALGAQTFATGNSSVTLGRNSLASATYSICIGNSGQNNIQSSIKFSGSQHANQGDAQIGLYPLMADTTDATATAMVTNHQGTPSAGTANQIVLPNNSAYAFHGTIVARQKAGDGTACAAWKIEGLIRREGSAGTTVLVNSATTVLDNTPSWGMALSADTTNGGLKVQVTGAASTNIRWTTSITTSELIYA